MIPIPKTSLQIYRDCLRLVKHIAPGRTGNKAKALRATIKAEFSKNRHVSDPSQIESLQGAAVRGLSNYMLALQIPSDRKVAAAADEYHKRSVEEAKSLKDSDSTKP